VADTGGAHDRATEGFVWVFAFGLAGIAARLWLWWFSIGSNDVAIWHAHGLHVLREGLAHSYREYQSFPQFNHPPLMGLYAAAARSWAGNDLWKFARLIKLPALAGEALTLWALWRFASPRAFAIYAALPAAILVSGFHGNTDPLYSALILVAAIAFDKEHYLLSGVLWGASLNVKLIPLAILPLPFLAAPTSRALRRLTAGCAIAMIPFVPSALTAGGAMYQNMVAYNSRPDNWGVTGVLNALSVKWSSFGPVRECWLVAGRYAIVIATTSLGLWARFRGRLRMTEQAALGAVLFLLLTPGFGVQYVVFAAPLLCLVDPKTGAVWGWMSGLFVGAVYWTFLVTGMPLQSKLMGIYPFPANAIGLVAWAVLAHFAWTRLAMWRAQFRQQTKPSG
jgi:hypothetical protein